MTPTSTVGTFKYIDPTSFDTQTKKLWGKVDGPGYSYRLTDTPRRVENIRGHEKEFSIDNAGFVLYKSPAKEKAFTDDKEVTNGYYAEVEELLRQKLSGVKKVVIFDHTIRRRKPGSARRYVLYYTIHRGIKKKPPKKKKKKKIDISRVAFDLTRHAHALCTDSEKPRSTSPCGPNTSRSRNTSPSACPLRRSRKITKRSVPNNQRMAAN